MKNLILILLTIPLLLAGCGKKDSAKDTQVDEVLAVQVQPVVRKSFTIPIIGSGVLASKSEMKLAFKTGGMIKKEYVSEGQLVKEGQLLAELDLAEMDAQVKQAHLNLEKTNRDLERVKKMYADTAATLQNLQDATTGYEAATQSVNMVEFNQKLSKIYAPTSGRVLKKMAEQGELLSAFSPVFILGTGESAYYLNIGLADREVVKVKIGDHATVTLDAYPNIPFKAIITQIAQTVTPGTGTFEVELQLEKTSGYKLVSGFVAKAEITPNSMPSTPVVPVEALVEADGNKAYVYTLNADNQTVTKMPITIGTIFQNEVAVTGGLSENAQIVAKGANFLSDRIKVKVIKSVGQ